MKSKLLNLIAALAFSAGIVTAAPLGTAFTYQGRLNTGGNPAQGTYDLRFTIYDLDSGGSLVAGPITNSPVTVSNGLFTSTLDFGPGIFTGDAWWLEIGVRTNGSASDFTGLAPRQPLTPTPYALYAPNAGTAATASGAAAGSISNAAIAVGAVDSGRIADGSVAAADLSPALLSTTFWRLDGNTGTTAGTHYVGTTDGQPLEFKVKGTRALRLEPDAESPNVIAGHGGNTVMTGINGVNIGGGGNTAGPNVVMGRFGTIGGGVGNVISTNAGDTTIGGGWLNVIAPFSGYATIGGGSHNTAAAVSATVAGGYANAALAEDSVVAGGYSNSVASRRGAVVGGSYNRVEPGYEGGFIGSGIGNRVAAHNSSVVGGYENSITNLVDGFIGGGFQNQISANHTVIGGGLLNTNAGPGATIGGGNNNLVAATANDAFIGGGVLNRVDGYRSVIGGGETNTIQTGSDYAVIAGGLRNDIGNNSGYTTIAGGRDNNIATASSYAAIAGGYLNDIGTNSDYSAVGGGYNNNVAADSGYATIAGGSYNDIGTNSDYSTISGGRYNGIRNGAQYATIPGGYYALADHYGQWTYASGRFVAAGDAQSGLYVLRGITSNASTNELFLDGSGARLTLRTNSTITFQVQVAAISDTGNRAGYEFSGVIHRTAAGVTALVGTVDNTMTKENASAFNFLVEADNANDALALKGVGSTGLCRWVATVRTTEVHW